MGEEPLRYEPFSLHPAIRFALSMIAAVLATAVPWIIISLVNSPSDLIGAVLFGAASIFISALPVFVLGSLAAAISFANGPPTFLRSLLLGAIASGIPAAFFFAIFGAETVTERLGLPALTILSGACAGAAAHWTWQFTGLLDNTRMNA